MKLLSIRTSSYRGAPPRKLDLTAPGGEPNLLVVVTGSPSVGKTSLLELLVRHKEHVAPYGRPTSSSDVLGAGDLRLEVSTQWLLEEEERAETGSQETRLSALSLWQPAHDETHLDPALVHVLSRYRHDDDCGKVDYMGTRRVAPAGPGAPGDPVFWQKKSRLSLGNDKYAGLGRLYANAGASRRDALSALLTELRPGLSPELDDSGNLVFETPAGRRTEAQLSLSQRLAFQLAASFALVGLHHSVVLIDTPELGLASGEGLTVLRALREHAPSTQLIVTTTDPAIINASETAVIQLESA